MAEDFRDNDEIDSDALELWVAENPAEALYALREKHSLQVALARQDCSTFCEYVGVDEETGDPITQAPVHEAMQDAADESRSVVILAGLEGGKSSQMTVLRTLWLLGRKPSLRVLILSSTETQAVKFLRAIKGYIETSERLHNVFPELKAGAKWSDNAITIRGAIIGAKDFSVQAVGTHSKQILGARIDHLVMDDIHDSDNSRTAKRRDELWAWVRATVLGRLTRSATVIGVGTPWHHEDVYHRLMALSSFKTHKFPVVDEHGSYTWPERWTPERYALVSERLGPLETARQLHLRPRSNEDKRFSKEWVDRCLLRGDGRTMPHHLDHLPTGYQTFTGVDLGIGMGASSAFTSMFTIALHPDDAREVLDVTFGKWSGPEILLHLQDVSHRFLSTVLVESNAAQKFLLQFAQTSPGAKGQLPVLPFHTGANKHDPEFGVESIGVELWRGQWIIPSRGGLPLTPGVGQWLREMEDYSPEEHTGDCLIGAWIAREGARTYGRPAPKKDARAFKLPIRR